MMIESFALTRQPLGGRSETGGSSSSACSRQHLLATDRSSQPQRRVKNLRSSKFHKAPAILRKLIGLV
jgi:hypothetical protein